MMLPVGFALIGILVGWYVLLRVKKRWSNHSTLSYPPGPPQLPFLGNFFNHPGISAQPGKECASLSEKYGDVVYFNVLGTSVIVLSSAAAVHDLLEKRSANYSDRPRSAMGHDLMGMDWGLGLVRYGEVWRNERRALHHAFNSSAMKQYHEIQTNAARWLIRLCQESPSDFFQHVRLVLSGSLVRMTYDIDVTHANEPYVHLIEDSFNDFLIATEPGRFLVNTFPAMKYIPAWFPGAYFRRLADKTRRRFEWLRDTPYDYAKDQLKAGTAEPSAIASMIKNLGEDQDFACRAAAIAGILAGSKSTVSLIRTLFLLMVLHPEVQKNAHAELDRVVGPDRLPTFEDRTSLPYIEAIVSELLRWHVATPLGGPRYLYVDDGYKGYRIPKQTFILGNAWAILHDPVQYPDPDKFIPERFLAEDGTYNRSVQDPDIACFGFGRRICPGRHLARDMLYIHVASTLHAFDITSALDDDGKPIGIDYAVTPGFKVDPIPFKCSIKPRAGFTEVLIE